MLSFEIVLTKRNKLNDFRVSRCPELPNDESCMRSLHDLSALQKSYVTKLYSPSKSTTANEKQRTKGCGT